MKKPRKNPASEPVDQGPDRQQVPASTLRALLDRCADGMCLVDPAGLDIIYANSAALDWVSRSGSPQSKRNVADWLPETDAAVVLDRLAGVAAGDVEEASFCGRVVTQGGDEVAAEFTARRLDAGSQWLLAIVVRKLPAEPLVAASHIGARTDPLTGLADRAFLLDRLTSLVEGERSRDHQCAVLFIDVDGFKQVNDAYGHLVGDRVLCEVARRLAECVRSDDHVARFGGDEFVVLLESVSGSDEIQPVVDRIGAAFDRPVEVPRGKVTLTVSVGVAEADRRGKTAEQLLEAADRAMYAAKRTAT